MFVLEKSIHNFGKIKPNTTNTAIFTYTNAGNKPLQIKNVQKCCGAVVTLDKEELAPGQSGTLTAKCPCWFWHRCIYKGNQLYYQ